MYLYFLWCGAAPRDQTNTNYLAVYVFIRKEIIPFGLNRKVFEFFLPVDTKTNRDLINRVKFKRKRILGISIPFQLNK